MHTRLAKKILVTPRDEEWTLLLFLFVIEDVLASLDRTQESLT